jgi:hypothetical protein
LGSWHSTTELRPQTRFFNLCPTFFGLLALQIVNLRGLRCVPPTPCELYETGESWQRIDGAGYRRGVATDFGIRQLFVYAST